MKTVGDVLHEVDAIQTAIQDLHTLKRQFADAGQSDLETSLMFDNAILLLSHYRSNLCELPIKPVKGERYGSA